MFNRPPAHEISDTPIQKQAPSGAMVTWPFRPSRYQNREDDFSASSVQPVFVAKAAHRVRSPTKADARDEPPRRVFWE